MTAAEGIPAIGREPVDGTGAGVSFEPVRQSVTVSRSAEDAFRLFTMQASTWWPLDSHSVYGTDAVACIFEPREGGRIYERTADGRESEWGRIKVWDPPRRFVSSWHPGHPADRGQEIEVRFESVGDRRTRVDLEHRGWELLGEEAAEARTSYDVGWAYVFGRRYAQEAGVFSDTRDAAGGSEG